MMNSQATAKDLVCDGCGFGATPEHIAKRLRRLELTTRYRPIHIQAVFLGAQSPPEERDFLYAKEPGFGGEGAALLRAVGIATDARAKDAVLAEFQKRGFLLTHILECAPEAGRVGADLAGAMVRRLPSVLKRLRGSLRPKRVVLISQELAPLAEELTKAAFGGEMVLDGSRPFDLSGVDGVSKLTSSMMGLC